MPHSTAASCSSPTPSDAACDPGWLLHGDSCYRRLDDLAGVSSQRRNLKQCAIACEMLGATLPCVADQCTNEVLVSNFAAPIEGGIWLGLYQSPGTLDKYAGWTNWVSSACTSNYTAWYPNGGLNDLGCVQEMCAVAWRAEPGGAWALNWDRHWYDWPCDDADTYPVECVCSKESSASLPVQVHSSDFASDLPALMAETTDAFRMQQLVEGSTASNATQAMCTNATLHTGIDWKAYGDKCFGAPAGIDALTSFRGCTEVCSSVGATLPCVPDGCANYWLGILAGGTHWLSRVQEAGVDTFTSEPLAGWEAPSHSVTAGCAAPFSGWRTWLVGDGVPDDFGFYQEACAVSGPSQPWNDVRCASTAHRCVCEYPGAFVADLPSTLARLEAEDKMLPHGVAITVGLSTMVGLVGLSFLLRASWLLTKRYKPTLADWFRTNVLGLQFLDLAAQAIQRARGDHLDKNDDGFIDEFTEPSNKPLQREKSGFLEALSKGMISWRKGRQAGEEKEKEKEEMKGGKKKAPEDIGSAKPLPPPPPPALQKSKSSSTSVGLTALQIASKMLFSIRPESKQPKKADIDQADVVEAALKAVDDMNAAKAAENEGGGAGGASAPAPVGADGGAGTSSSATATYRANAPPALSKNQSSGYGRSTSFIAKRKRSVADLNHHDFLVHSALSDSTIRIVRCEWLRKLPKGHVLSRLQELPAEAFLPPSDAAANFFKLDRSTCALSHGWLTPDHPDPHGLRLQSVIAFLSSDVGLSFEGMFWDWASIPQKDSKGKRTPEERTTFTRALNVMAGLYASPYTSVLVNDDLLQPPDAPPDKKAAAAAAAPTSSKPPKPSTSSAATPRLPYNPTPYMQRGWCLLEFSAASVIVGVTGDSDEANGLPPKLLNCTAQQPMPIGRALNPEQFGAELEKAKFTGKGDAKIVRAMYLSFYLSIGAQETALANIAKQHGIVKRRQRVLTISSMIVLAVLLGVFGFFYQIFASDVSRVEASHTPGTRRAWHSVNGVLNVPVYLVAGCAAVLFLLPVRGSARTTVALYLLLFYVGFAFMLVFFAYMALRSTSATLDRIYSITFVLRACVSALALLALTPYLGTLGGKDGDWPPKTAYLFLWKVVRAFFLLFSLVEVTQLIYLVVDDSNNRSNGSFDTRLLYLGVVPIAFSVLVLITSDRNRRTLLRWLAKPFRRGGGGWDDDDTAAIAALVGNVGQVAFLRDAQAQFKLIAFDQLKSADDLAGDHENVSRTPKEELQGRAKNASFGQPGSFFVSHSNLDARADKFAALSRWNRAYHKAWLRDDQDKTTAQIGPEVPLLWTDSACRPMAVGPAVDAAVGPAAVDAARPKWEHWGGNSGRSRKTDEAIALMALFTVACQDFMCLAGPTYSQRLWCIIELFCFLKNAHGQPFLRVVVLPVLPASRLDVSGVWEPLTSRLDDPGSDGVDQFAKAIEASRKKLSAFSIKKCSCFDPKMKRKLLACINAGFSNFSIFDQMVRDIFEDRLITKHNSHLPDTDMNAADADDAALEASAKSASEKAGANPVANAINRLGQWFDFMKSEQEGGTGAPDADADDSSFLSPRGTPGGGGGGGGGGGEGAGKSPGRGLYKSSPGSKKRGSMLFLGKKGSLFSFGGGGGSVATMTHAQGSPTRLSPPRVSFAGSPGAWRRYKPRPPMPTQSPLPAAPLSPFNARAILKKLLAPKGESVRPVVRA